MVQIILVVKKSDFQMVSTYQTKSLVFGPFKVN